MIVYMKPIPIKRGESVLEAFVCDMLTNGGALPCAVRIDSGSECNALVDFLEKLKQLGYNTKSIIGAHPYTSPLFPLNAPFI